MQITRIAIVAFVALAACGVQAIDFSQKTCPCPSGLDCDPSTNKCVPAGTVQPASVPGSPACVPKSCDELQIDCGLVADDGCGKTLDCGGCTAPDQCVANKCQCIPASMCPAGFDCGTVPTGCPGNPLDCSNGTPCPASKPNCGGGGMNKCGTGACTPKTACDPGQCGTVSDNCSGTITCAANACTAPQTCGGGGTANQCGCTSKTCAQLGWQCGSGPDGCGGTLVCPPGGGGCSGGKVCNYGTHACQCATCGGQYGWQCGSGPDGCGGSLNCGGCSVGTCQGNHQCDN